MALAKWSLAPTELESDLLGKADIHDWHRGTRDEHGVMKLSSRRLIVLIDHLPDTSSYKTALRGGYWPEAQLIAAQTHNELAYLRSSYYAVNGGEDSTYEPFQFLDPVVRLDKALKEIEEDAEADADNAQFYTEMGWY